MEDLFNDLESRIRDLVSQKDQLEYSNQHLHMSKSQLTRAYESLLAKQQQTIVQIEHVMAKLKAIEKLL